jgi:hypothetical protein
VEEIWYFEGTLTRLRERHYPNGCMDLAIHFGPRYRRIHEAGAFNRDFREFANLTPSEYRARLRFPESRSTAEPAPEHLYKTGTGVG